MKLRYYLSALLLTALSPLSSSDKEEENGALKLQCSREIEKPDHVCQAISTNVPYRLIANIDPQGWNVTFDDGSVWRAVNSSGAYQISHWHINDSIVIHPCAWHYWNGGRFFLHNERLNSYAVVELSTGPYIGVATNSQLTYIDYTSGVIQLQDGAGRASYFRLNRSDRSIYKNWVPGQSIILGSNEDCYAGWFSSYPYILINVENDSFVTANLD